MRLAQMIPQSLDIETPTREKELQLVLDRIRLRAQRRANWLEAVLQEANTCEEPLADRDSPDRELAWHARQSGPLNDRLADVENALASLPQSRLRELAKILSLSEDDLNLLQACLAVELDPSLGALFAYLHGHANRSYVTEELAARLFGYPRLFKRYVMSNLKSWRLIREVEVNAGDPSAIVFDRQILVWLLGSVSLHETLAGRASMVPTREPLGHWPLEEAASFARRMASGDAPVQTWIQVTGTSGGGRRTFAACLSAQMGFPLLAIDADAIPEQDWEAAYCLAQRQALLDHWALAWYGDCLPLRRWPKSLSTSPIQFAILLPEQACPAPPESTSLAVRLPPLTVDEQQRLWRRSLPAATWQEKDLNLLATRYRATPGEIAAVARCQPAGAEEAAERLRESQRDRLGKLAQRLDCPFRWDDLVVSDTLREALEDFVFEARDRALFWEQPHARRLFPQGRGLAGLFSGPPGTGKTMAAQVIAAGLGLDLFRIDLSSVISKYVGETSQNLERILSRAAYMDIVLLFDEADSLFGKRTEIRDAHDRFANTETNYLLQAIENYTGIVLLATNKKSNMDPAFLRRLRYILEFSPPDEAQRLSIWRQVVTELAGAEAAARLEKNLRVLAHEVITTGAQIKFSILAALFVARREQQPLAIGHLLRGLKRELLKEGRSLSEREVENLSP